MEKGENKEMSEPVKKDSPDYLFGEICTRLEIMDKDARERHTEILGKFEKHDERIGKLERIKQWAIGGAAVGGSGGAMAWWKNIFNQ